MVLNFVGAGLGDIDDFTVKGIEALAQSEWIYLEQYTSIQENLTVERLSRKFPKASVKGVDRDFVESGCDAMLEKARQTVVSFVVIGDPFCATTHADLYLRAKEKNVLVRVIHNTSIINAVGCTGLQLYRFGQIVSIPFFDGNWRPDSFLDKIQANMKEDLHTLCLLDIKVKEQTVENMMKHNNIYEPPRFMSINTALEQLIEAVNNRPDCAEIIQNTTIACGVARVGSENQIIKFGTLEELIGVDFGKELHSLIICAPTLHEVESQFVKLFS